MSRTLEFLNALRDMRLGLDHEVTSFNVYPLQSGRLIIAEIGELVIIIQTLSIY